MGAKRDTDSESTARTASSHRVAVFVGACAAMALAGTPAVAAPTNTAGTRLIAFADSHSVGPAQILDDQLQADRFNYCTGRAPATHPMSVATAIGVAKNLVAKASHGRGLAAFTHGREGHNERTAMAAAAGALSTGKPEAALAALLRAHQLKPADPLPLIDAAPLLTQDGQPDAALAFLGGVQSLKLPRSHPFGLDWHAVIAANRGQALMAAHRWGAAATALGAALRGASLLVEADQNMAVTLECQGKRSEARRFLAAAGRRQTFQKGDLIGSPNQATSINPVEILDTSQGQKLVLETFRYPRTVQEGHATWRAYNKLDGQTSLEPLIQTQNADQRLTNAVLARATPATKRRTLDIQQAIDNAARDPTIAPLYNKALELLRQASALEGETLSQAGCPDHGASHGRWLSLIQAYDTAWRTFAVAIYSRQTALAANLSEAHAHQVGLDKARLNAQVNFRLLIAGGEQITLYDAACDTSIPPQENPESGQRQEPASKPCPAGIEGLDFAIDLKVISLSVNCEEVSAEVGFGEGWLGTFVNATHNFKKGSTTIFAGAQAGVKLPGPLGVGGGFRSGAYVTFGADGSVQDVGMRAGHSASLNAGALSVSNGDQMDFSFVGSSS